MVDRRLILKLLGGASSAVLLNAPTSSRLRAVGDRFLQVRVPIIDGNLVAPLNESGHVDQKTAAQVKSAGLTAFKQTLGGNGDRSKTQTDEEIDLLNKAVALNSDLFSIVRRPMDLVAGANGSRIGIIPSFEAAEMLEGALENIDYFRRKGVLVMGLSYNRTTPFASGTLSHASTGLSALGHDAVSHMNALGVTVDVSHSDERSTFQVLSASTKPVLITHAGCAAVQSHPRNKSDALLSSLAKGGGMIGIYELSFLTHSPRQPTLDDYMAHLLHALNVCGEDHVGIGTDGGLLPFDTSTESMESWNAEIARRKASGVSAPGEGPPPFVVGLNRPDRYAVIADALRRRGYSARIVDKILGINFQRVFDQTWRG